MVLYGITIISLVEELWVEDPELLALFFADDATFDGSVQ